MENHYQEYLKAVEKFQSFRDSVIPLCAAENIMSDFTKSPQILNFQERYILGGHLDYVEEDNMIGSKALLPFYNLAEELCYDIFGANYTDSRSLSGMNALQNLILCFMEKDNTILNLSPESGGHASIPNILTKLGIKYLDIPFDYDNYSIDYAKTNNLLQNNKIDFILLAPSDILFLPELEKLEVDENTIIIFDATQVLGFFVNSPNRSFFTTDNLIVMAGTHKTLPGPAKAIIMTNTEKLAHKIDATINPLYIRNTHLQNVASLILSLIEANKFGQKYANEMVKNSNYLGGKLSEYGFDILGKKDFFSETHQLFIHMNEKNASDFFRKSCRNKVSLNKKSKLLFKDSGIRIGVQEITRYGWNHEDLDLLAQLLYIINTKEDSTEIDLLKEYLLQKNNIKYTFRK